MARWHSAVAFMQVASMAEGPGMAVAFMRAASMAVAAGMAVGDTGLGAADGTGPAVTAGMAGIGGAVDTMGEDMAGAQQRLGLRLEQQPLALQRTDHPAISCRTSGMVMHMSSNM
jgi:hypothetical protein